MRTSRLLSLVVPLVSVGLAACGSPPPMEGGTDASTEIPIERFKALFAERACEQLARCEQPLDDVDLLRALLSAEECRREIEVFEPSAEVLLASGDARFDEVAAAECLASFEDLCSGGHRDPACSDVIVGVHGDGGACRVDAQCASGFCSGNALQCGTCIPTSEVGGECSTGMACNRGAYCNGTCYRLTEAALGESCASAVGPRPCAADTYCDERTLVCTARAPVGATCLVGGDTCASGAICLAFDFVGYCTALVETEEVDAPCGPQGNLYVTCARTAGLRCGNEDRCEPIEGDGATGAACDFQSDCDGGRCVHGDDGRGTCAAEGRSLGETCRGDADCGSGYCDTADGSGACAVLPACAEG